MCSHSEHLKFCVGIYVYCIYQVQSRKNINNFRLEIRRLLKAE